jgi:hypothetical protein
MRLLQNSRWKSVRVSVAPNGDLWAWDADDALHQDVDHIIDGADVIGCVVFEDHIDIQKVDRRLLRQSLAANPTMKALGIARMKIVPQRRY